MKKYFERLRCWLIKKLGGYTVEDVKSRATKTHQYAMKKKLMQEHFAIYIQEV